MKQVVWDRPVEVGAWVAARIGASFHPSCATAIGMARHGVLVGGCIFENCTGQSVVIHCAGDGKYWMNHDFLCAVFGYCFRQLGVKKTIAPVDSENLPSRHFVENLGFLPEAKIADGGQHGDLILYTLTRQACRFLGE